MSVKKDDRYRVESILESRDDLSPGQITRFLGKASKGSRECPYCKRKGGVYFCTSKVMCMSDGARFGMFLLSYGTSALFSGGLFYLCVHCTHSGSDWY